MIFGWETIAKILSPIVFTGAVYFYGHGVGYDARDAKVAGEIQAAVDTAVAGRDAACKKDQKLIGGINDDLTKGLQAANDRYADAIGKLYDTTHGATEGTGSAGTAELHNGTTGDNRLYYSDNAAARAVLDRDRIASIQARQLIGCQAYIAGIRKPQEGADRAK